MSSIYHNLRTDQQYRAATALSKEQFELLFTAFDQLYIPKTANPYSDQSLPVLTDKREALFFILHYYKAYPTLQNMGLYFGFSSFAASRYIDLLSPILKTCLKDYQPLQANVFKSQQAFEKAFENVSDLIIDVTEIAIERPQNREKQQQHYSGKKNLTPANGS